MKQTMLPIPLKTLGIAILAIMCLGWCEPGYTQTLTIGDNQLILQEGTQLNADNLMSDDSTLIITPGEGMSVASVKMQNATQTIFFYGQKITVQQKSNDFRLEGEGKIQWDKNTLIGPKEIVFVSAENTLKLYGTAKEPASIDYTGFAFKGKAEWFIIQGEKVNGNWTPNHLKSGPMKEGTIGPNPGKSKPVTVPGPKLSAPNKK